MPYNVSQTDKEATPMYSYGQDVVRISNAMNICYDLVRQCFLSSIIISHELSTLPDLTLNTI